MNPKTIAAEIPELVISKHTCQYANEPMFSDSIIAPFTSEFPNETIGMVAPHTATV